jgi:hypothetical protein
MLGIEQKINEVNGTMAMEGLPLTEADKNAMRDVLSGKISFDDMKKKIIAEYKQPENPFE